MQKVLKCSHADLPGGERLSGGLITVMGSGGEAGIVSVDECMSRISFVLSS
jgi:hypothetical protein